ncbi:aconitate hydratase B, partial [Kingella kingae]|nr:aconitate hydratase B [Kingella kingae]
MLQEYRQAAAERAALGIPALPLTATQMADLADLLKNPPAGEGEFLVDLLTNRVPAGVDDAAKVKASFLAAIAHGSVTSPLVSPELAAKLLGTMLGGYNIHPLIELLDNEKLAPIAAEGLKHTLLMFDSFHDVKEKADKGNVHAKAVLQSWADAEWFTSRQAVPEKITVTVFKVDGETNTDDLSPAPDAWSRPDIPLHALAMLKNPRDGITPDKAGEVGPI